jgi:uncharacterized phiE125 gp8 family phage protein
MAALLLTPPAAEPLSLADAKAFLRVEHDDDDALIETLIRGARGAVEARTRRALITQSWRLVLDAWPRDGRIAAPLAPVRTLTAARVYDSADLAHALDVEAFVLDAASGAIGFTPWGPAPPGRGLAGIEIDVVAGYGDTAADVPEPLRQAVRLLTAHWYENRSLGGGAAGAPPLPAGLDRVLAPYRVLTL